MALFYDPVRVPDGAANGMAKITLSFPDWRDRQVVPATIEVPIVDKPRDFKKQ